MLHCRTAWLKPFGNTKTQTELRKVKKEIAGLKKKLTALEVRKAEIEKAIENSVNKAYSVILSHFYRQQIGETPHGFSRRIIILIDQCGGFLDHTHPHILLIAH